ncbi:hypothetical protein G5C51_23855 [Streptomyces sp. A7024]|uniref:Uncharacterized protein n=1 Tax=Streptomyces coryli TaxID=1128680 RepID=A0A6G4U6B3_9ACTN|nr:hypothetical protein [Streptomyces coryli]NGN66928.1 hypothetical protein [Streptomyces coryli]
MEDQRRSGEGEGLPDDIWEKFEKDSWGRIDESAPKEPSARARMVEERFRQEEAARAAAPRRKRRRVRRPRPNLSEGRLRTVLISVAVIGGMIAVSALAAWLQYGRVF